MREFVSVAGIGLNTGQDQDEIAISIYGPRGGCRAIEGISPDAARQLVRDLIAALDKFPRPTIPASAPGAQLRSEDASLSFEREG